MCSNLSRLITFEYVGGINLTSRTLAKFLSMSWCTSDILLNFDYDTSFSLLPSFTDALAPLKSSILAPSNGSLTNTGLAFKMTHNFFGLQIESKTSSLITG